MRRIFWSVSTVAVVVLWLVFSYRPGAALPAIRYPAWSLPVLAALALTALIAFLLVQIWVAWSTDRALTSSRRLELVQEFHLQRRRELIWTVLPIGMTLLTAGAAVATWVALL